MERQLIAYTKMLDNAQQKRKATVAQLTTVDTVIKSLKESIPVGDEGDDAAESGTGRGRSRDTRLADSERRLAEAEEKKEAYNKTIAECDETKENLTPLVTAYRTAAETLNGVTAQISAHVERLGDSGDEQ